MSSKIASPYEFVEESNSWVRLGAPQFDCGGFMGIPHRPRGLTTPRIDAWTNAGTAQGNQMRSQCLVTSRVMPVRTSLN
jgi:hypothetical protein